MNLLRLTQTSPQPGTFHIRIQLQIPGHNDQTADSDFSFSLSDDQQERFRWYLEDFLQYPQYPAGKLDSVMVFNHALSDEEVKALYNSQSEDTVLHDEAGNLVMDQRGYQYEYDHDNRLTKITQDSTDIAECTYDALGRRIEKIEYDTTNITTRYYYDGWRVLSETNAAGEIQRDYVYGNYLDEALMLIDTDDHYYAHNHLYSPVALINDSGTVLERYEYDVYGKPYFYNSTLTTLLDPQKSGHNNPVMFTGQRMDRLDDGNLILMHYKTRQYLPSTGRFLQRDLMQYVEGVNLYEYVSSTPVLRNDPKGYFGEDFHRVETMYLATLAGFCNPAAMGNWAYAPDLEHPAPAAFVNALAQWLLRVMTLTLANPQEYNDAINALWEAQRWHFPLQGDRVVAGTGNAAAMAELEAGLDGCNLERFSRGLHALQDSYAHQGSPPGLLWVLEHNQMYRMGHSRSEHDWLDPLRILSALSLDADSAELFGDSAREAAMQVYLQLLRFRERCLTCEQICGPAMGEEDVRRILENQYRGPNYTRTPVNNLYMENAVLEYLWRYWVRTGQLNDWLE